MLHTSREALRRAEGGRLCIEGLVPARFVPKMIRERQARVTRMLACVGRKDFARASIRQVAARSMSSTDGIEDGSNGVGKAEEERSIATYRERVDWEAFRQHGHELVEFIADYYKNVEAMPVKSQVQPGYLRERLPGQCPEKPEEFAAIMHDVEKHIMPGITHWQHPQFGAYFSANSSWPGLAGEMLSGATRSRRSAPAPAPHRPARRHV